MNEIFAHLITSAFYYNYAVLNQNLNCNRKVNIYNCYVFITSCICILKAV